MKTEDEHRGQHDFYRDNNWEKCHGCDYWEPVGMVYLPEGE